MCVAYVSLTQNLHKIYTRYPRPLGKEKLYADDQWQPRDGRLLCTKPSRMKEEKQ